MVKREQKKMRERKNREGRRNNMRKRKEDKEAQIDLKTLCLIAAFHMNHHVYFQCKMFVIKKTV